MAGREEWLHESMEPWVSWFVGGGDGDLVVVGGFPRLAAGDEPGGPHAAGSLQHGQTHVGLLSGGRGRGRGGGLRRLRWGGRGGGLGLGPGTPRQRPGQQGHSEGQGKQFFLHFRFLLMMVPSQWRLPALRC